MCILQRDLFQEKERKDDDSNEFVSAVTWKPVGGLEWLCFVLRLGCEAGSGEFSVLSAQSVVRNLVLGIWSCAVTRMSGFTLNSSWMRLMVAVFVVVVERWGGGGGITCC